MRKSEGSTFYIFLLLVSVAVTVLVTDFLRHLWFHQLTPVPSHTHLTAIQAGIVLFCFLFYLADRFRLFHLSLRLCFLSLFLVGAKIFFNVQTGRFAVNAAESVFFIFVATLLIALSRHPIRMLEKGKIPS